MKFIADAMLGSLAKRLRLLGFDVLYDPSSPDNEVLVLDTGTARVQIFDQNGKFLRKFGNEGKGPGEFRFPAGLALEDGVRLSVGDRGNGRIQVFALLQTPAVPSEVTAQPRMNEVQVSWKPCRTVPSDRDIRNIWTLGSTKNTTSQAMPGSSSRYGAMRRRDVRRRPVARPAVMRSSRRRVRCSSRPGCMTSVAR